MTARWRHTNHGIYTNLVDDRRLDDGCGACDLCIGVGDDQQFDGRRGTHGHDDVRTSEADNRRLDGGRSVRDVCTSVVNDRWLDGGSSARGV